MASLASSCVYLNIRQFPQDSHRIHVILLKTGYGTTGTQKSAILLMVCEAIDLIRPGETRQSIA